MKIRQSGMPDMEYWNNFFDAPRIIEKLFTNTPPGNTIEFGCGYGTFTMPASLHTQKTLYAFDIEPSAINSVTELAHQQHIFNIKLQQQDFIQHGTGLTDESATHVMIYNLLHLENPGGLLKQAYQLLKPNGVLSIMHWRSDIETPRGPSLEIRPTPEQSKKWLESTGFHSIQKIDIEVYAPYHFSYIAIKGCNNQVKRALNSKNI
ncbi:class I SAM-dependent methyltransferase [Thiomicrorhabdus arctica]|uniref:class I SAM-dependent methyltransferase n=1 Tax=Thiomicrorhabdus arctica TaxID=131540 RepID=UPI0012FDD7AC|nr:class I SAM-dependent methyltransferase [Thiomicrorhabdus arctica]